MDKINSKKKDGIKISLVIGCIKDDLSNLKILLNSLDSNLKFIDEIVCIVSEVNDKDNLEKILDIDLNVRKKLTIKKIEKLLFPGEARNYGIMKAKFNYIAFLDVKTIPSPNWLEVAKNLLNDKNPEGLFGATKYKPYNRFDKCFIASTYGLKSITTLPGSIFNSRFINSVGLFITSIRSSEDREWMTRAKKLSKNLVNQKMLPLSYEDLKNRSFLELMKKWYFYYDQISCEQLSIYNYQKFIYLFFFFTGLILFCNLIISQLFSEYNNINFLYLSLFYFFIYFIFRIILMPLKKGFNFLRNGFFDIFRIFIVSFSIDLIKTYIFIKSTYRGIIE